MKRYHKIWICRLKGFCGGIGRCLRSALALLCCRVETGIQMEGRVGAEQCKVDWNHDSVSALPHSHTVRAKRNNCSVCSGCQRCPLALRGLDPVQSRE